jgi:thymidylate synthase
MEKTNVNNNSLDKQYQDLLQDILDNGVVKGDRTGTGTVSVFGRQIRHNMKDGFPLLTTKKMPFKNIATELIWFLKGDTNIKFLVDNGCNIWNGDAYKNYLKNAEYHQISWLFSKAGHEEIEDHNDHTQYYRPFTMEEFIDKIKTDDEFAKKWGELGPVYGRQWRDWKGFKHGWHDVAKIIDGIEPHIDWLTGIDQIFNLVKDLTNNPDSRRLMVNAWNVAEIDDMVLPPCHYGFQVYTRELTYDEKYVNHPELIDYHNQKVVMAKVQDYQNAAKLRDLEKQYLDKHSDELSLLPKRAISLMWNQRSVDTFLGLPFNIASYGLLLEILAKEVNMVPDQLIGNLGDTHLYSNHLEQAKEQIERESFNLPSIEINDSWKFGSSSPVFADKLKLDMFELVDYKSHGAIKAPLSN